MEEKKYKLSFLQREYVNVTILKMLSPARFLVKEAPSVHGSEQAKAFKNLEEAMDMYYRTYQTEINELPCSGSIIAVCPDGNWYRARVESILETTVGPRVLAYLLDYGKMVNVEKCYVRKPFPRLHEVPFQVLEFQLYDIAPCSLIMQPDCLMVYGQSEQWDIAAEEFVKKIVSSKRCAQMNTIYVDSNDILYGDLLVSIDEEFVSLSKELMNNHFASTVAKVKIAHQKHETKGKVDCSHSNVIEGYNTASKQKKSKQKRLLEIAKAGTVQENEVQIIANHDQTKNVSSMQSALLKKLQCHQNEQQKHLELNQREFHELVPEQNENEFSTTKTLVKPNFANVKKSQMLPLAVKRNSIVISINNTSQSINEKNISKQDVIDVTDIQQTASYNHSNCTSMVRLLQRLEAKEHYIKTDNSSNKSSTKLITNGTSIVNENCNREKTKDVTLKTRSILETNNDKEHKYQSRCALKMAVTSNNTSLTEIVEETRTVEKSKVLCKTRQGKLHHLQHILQKTLRKPKQELQSINYKVEKSPESKLDVSNIVIHQNEGNKLGKPLRTFDLSNTSVCPKSESFPSCKKTEHKTEKSCDSSQLVLKKSYSFAEDHIFNKFLSKLGNSSNEAIAIEKSISVNNKENIQTSFKNCISPVLCNKDTEINNSQNMSSNLPHSTILKQFQCQNLHPLETDQLSVNSTFEVNKMKLVKQCEQNEEISKDQERITDSKMIFPKNRQVDAHFKTTLDKWDGSLWDSNKLVQTICYGKGIPKPIKSITSAGFNTFIVQSLKEMHFPGPFPVQTLMWPSILRGRSVLSIAPGHSGKTFGYLLPLLSYILEPSLYEGLPTAGGPLALILCSSWKKAQNLHDHCRILLDKCTQVKILVTYGGGCEKLQKMSLINGCDVLIATPPSFLRLLQSAECRIIDLKRCCYLVIDDGDAVLEMFKEEIVDILKEYGTCLQSRKNLDIPNQTIVCCEHWKNDIASFVRHCMLDPLIFIASPFEAAVYARVVTYCHFTLKSQSYSVLANIIDGCHGKRVVICTSDDTNAKNIYKFLQNMSIYVILALSSTLHYEVNSLMNEWNSMLSPDTVHVLIIADNILLDLGISNANCLIQCNLESTSRINFGLRYNCLSDNYYSIEQIQKKEASNCMCHLLLTEDCINITPALINLLRHLPLKVPSKLQLLADERKKQLERNKSDLCYFLKAYGHCPNKSTCNERHTVSKEFNRIELPKIGQVRVLVCYVIDATHYYVRIIEHKDPSSNCMLSPSSYLDINLKLMEYYCITDNRIAEDKIEVGKICVVERPGSTYHRVRIEEIIHYNSLGIPRRVKLHYLDEGWQEVDDAQKLLKISSELAAYPFQIVEVYICNVQPVDKCYEWTPQANTFVHNIIGDKEMTGKIMLTLGCSMWLEPFVHYIQINESNIVIKESNVRTTLIKEGFAMSICNHIENLYTLCDGIIALPPKNLETKPVINDNIQHAFLELNKVHRVYVYAIQSPDIFFIQRYDRVDLIDGIQKELQELYKKHKLKKLENAQKGLICIAPFSEDDNYYRARIEEFPDSKSDDKVGLFYVDFGDRDFARKEDLYYIPLECLLLPFQAIECSLGRITTPCGGWSEEVNNVFDSLTITSDEVRKPLLLKVLKKEPSLCTGGHHYAVELWEEGCELGSLSEILVNQGMAISTNLSILSETPVPSDDDLSDKEDSMALVMYSAVCFGNLPKTPSKKKAKYPLNEVQNDSNNKPADSIQKQVLSSEYTGIPPLEKCNIGYTIPQVLWWQKKDEVMITIQLIDVKSFDTTFKEKHVLFTTKIHGKVYKFNEELFDSINSDKSKAAIIGQHVKLILVKLKGGINWPRLTACSKNRPYIRLNFDHLSDCSSDDEHCKIIKADPKDIIHFEPSDEEYLTDDNDDDDDDEWNNSRYDNRVY